MTSSGVVRTLRKMGLMGKEADEWWKDRVEKAGTGPRFFAREGPGNQGPTGPNHKGTRIRKTGQTPT